MNRKYKEHFFILNYFYRENVLVGRMNEKSMLYEIT